VKAHELRNELREEREVAANSGADFMKSLGALFANNVPNESKDLIALYEKYCDDLDHYQSQEDSYNAIEDQADLQDYELDVAEDRLYRRHSTSDTVGSAVSPDHESSTSSAPPSEPFIEYPSVVMEWLSSRR
jgi:hypothetical protein